jgi:hypothetical protein
MMMKYDLCVLFIHNFSNGTASHLCSEHALPLKTLFTPTRSPNGFNEKNA